MAGERSERVPFPDDIRIADWLLEPSLDRLSRNGTVVHLRPQLTNLLVLLAQHAGRTVSKDEILSKVWEGQFVAESGMTRCIAEIRQALEDDARDPKIVQTITKRGYRLMAPVERVAVPVAEETAVQQTPSGSAEAEPVVVAPPAFGGTDPAAATARARRLTVRAALWTAACVPALLAVTWGATTRSRPPLLSERDTVLLADVANTTGDPAFDQTLRLALAVNLGQAPFLRILPDARVRASLALMGQPPQRPIVGGVALELCRREGATLLLAGSISRMGSHYAVGLEAIACAGGESIDRELMEVDSKDKVLGALGAAAGRLRRTLGESRESLSKYDVPIARATTPSLDALKALSLGDLERDRARTSEALMYFRRATELDPQFALAWARRGAAAHNMARAVSDERSGEFAEAKLSFQKAYELRDRVSEPERLYILAHYYRSVLGDPDKALDTYALWSRMYPGSSIPAINSASIRSNLFGQYEAALADAREGVRMAPTGATSNLTLVATYLGVNRLPEARQALHEGTMRGVNNLEWQRMAFEMAILDGNAAAAQEPVRWASADAAATTVMTGLRALAAASAGRLRDARRLWSEAQAGAATHTPALRTVLLLAQAEAEALIGDPSLAREAAGAAVGIDPRASTRLSAASTLALAGDARGAEKVLRGLSHRSEPDTMTTYVWQPVARALVAVVTGRPDEARQVLGRVTRFERGRYFRLVPLGVRAAIEHSSGHPQEAAAAFGDLLRLHQIAPVSPWVPFARLGLARALRDAGDVAGSRAAYDAVIESMKDGDQDAPVLAAARRERR